MQIFSYAHIYDIVWFQIYFRRTAGPFDDQSVIGLCQARQGVLYRRKGLQGISIMVFLSGHIAYGQAVDDDLGAGVSRRLEQDRIHIDSRLQSCRFGLRHLGPAHFPAVSRHIGVQRHVLRLKRDDALSFLQKNAA